MRRDLIETDKILMGLDKLDAEKMFPMLWKSRTRGHSLRIKGKPFMTEMRKDFFTQRVMNVWNSFLRKAVGASLLDIFKRGLDIAFVAKGIK
eukprot:g32207.t1